MPCSEACRRGLWRLLVALPLLTGSVPPARSETVAAAPYERVEFMGDLPLDAAVLRSALRLPLPADSLLAALGRVGSLLYERGYLQATLQAEPAPPGLLRLRVDGGEPLRLHHVFLRGQEVLSAREIEDILGMHGGGEFVPARLEAGMGDLVETYAKRGFLQATAVIERLELEDEGMVLGIAISEGPAARLSEVRVQGNTHSRSELVQRLSGLGPAHGVDLGRLRESTQRLRRSGLFAAVEEPLVYRAGSRGGELGVMLRVVEAPRHNAFFGSVGVAQDPRDGQAYLSGAVDLQLRNIWGTGRDLAVAWKRDALAGTNLGVAYRERFLFGWRLDFDLDLAQTVRDSTYTFQTASAAIVLPLNAYVGLELGSAFDRSVFHVGRQGDSRRLRGRLGLLFQTLSSADDGRPYGRVEVRAEYARKSNSFVLEGVEDLSRHQQTLWSGLVEGAWPLGRRHEIGARGTWHILDSDEAEIVDSELFYFGGARTLRGYREDQFRGDQILYGGLEYRFGDPRGAQVYAFADAGGLRRKRAAGGFQREEHVGYGLGLRGQVATGIFDLAFAIGEDRSLSGAKLHVSLLQRF